MFQEIQIRSAVSGLRRVKGVEICETILVLMWLVAGDKLVHTELVYDPIPNTKCKTTSDWLVVRVTLWILANLMSGCSKQASDRAAADVEGSVTIEQPKPYVALCLLMRRHA